MKSRICATEVLGRLMKCKWPHEQRKVYGDYNAFSQEVSCLRLALAGWRLPGGILGLEMTED